MNVHRFRSLRRLALFVTLCLAALAAIGTTAASGYLYWSDPTTGTITRDTISGAAQPQPFIKGIGQPYGLAVAGGHIYWANFGGSVGRANLDGSDVEAAWITGGQEPISVAVDAGHVYWANRGASTIGRANLAGGEVEQDWITDASYPLGLAVDSEHVYWVDDGPIARADKLTGEDVEPTFIPETFGAFGVAVGAEHIYWTNALYHQIARAKIDGTEPEQGIQQGFVEGASIGKELAIDSGHIYWANAGTASISRANIITGTEVEGSFRSASSFPWGVAIGKAPSAATLSASTQAPVLGSALTLSASVKGVQPTGPVTFSADGATLGTVPLSGTSASLATSSLGLGHHTITASYGGDEGNEPSQSAPLPVSVVEPAPDVALRYSPNTPHRPNPKGGPRWTFRFSSALPGASFECSLDGGAFKRCSSPKVYRNLNKGKHVFRVRARSAEGLYSAVKKVKFTARTPR